MKKYQKIKCNTGVKKDLKEVIDFRKQGVEYKLLWWRKRDLSKNHKNV